MGSITAHIRDGAAYAAISRWARLTIGHRQKTGIERARLALWIPVLFASGIGVYFVLPEEPDFVQAMLPAVLCAGVAAGFRHRWPSVHLLGLAGMVVAAGFMTAQIRTAVIAGPVLLKEIGPVPMSARVIGVEPMAKGMRLTLDRVSVGRAKSVVPPDRVRISVRSMKTRSLPGDRISALVILQPPPPPSMPGGFDFARKAWFERIGGVGFALGSVSINGSGDETSWRIALARLRLDLTNRILKTSSERIGPLAAALLTGERRSIPERTLAAMRDSGLAHLLAISGLHIGLVAGLLFFAVRLLLALIEPVALRYPIKKYAAAAAVAGAFAYLLVSGATIPTQRAFLMVTIVMFAVMIDRTAISMRLVAVSAIIVLLLAPESLLSASFQMSFAAVVGLVAVYEASAPTFNRLRQRGGLFASRICLFLIATMLTTLIASAATAPFAIYHFNRIALYGMVANLVAVPVMAMWIMPFGLLSFLLMPFGLESMGLIPMGWGIEVVLQVAEWITALPGSVALVPPMTTAALVIIALGGLWLCLNRTTIRYLGIPAIAMGFTSIYAASTPDVLINRDGTLSAIVLNEGDVVMAPGKGHRFERDMWQRRLAVSNAPAWPTEGVSLSGQVGCDDTGCVFRAGDKTVALIAEPAAAMDDCGWVDYVILLTRVPRTFCRGSEVVASTFHIWRDGAHEITFSADGPVVRTSREVRGDRPWSRLGDRKRQYLRTRPTSRP